MASIMFTDVVGFSRHTAVDEERTYRALNRDFDIIYRLVAKHGGQVLNTMGDGMMIVFFTASACMRCALDIQSELHVQRISKPIDGVLQHRIGLHLGEIILNGKNTMGDGVNQAARIQSLARPDSIAMSKEFHGIAEKETTFTAKYLGPQRAKNIPENIHIWEIPPIDDMLRQKAAEALFTPPTSDSAQGATGRRGALLLVLVLVLLAIALTPIFLLKSANEIAQKNGRTFAPGKSDKNTAIRIKEQFQNIAANNEPAKETNTPESNNAPQTSSGLSLTPDQIADIAAKTNMYDYAGVATELGSVIGSNSSQGVTMIKKYESLVQFKSWLDAQVSSATEAAPISITIEGAQANVYSTNDGVVISQNGQNTTKKLWDYKPATIEAIAESLSAKSADGTNPNPSGPIWIGTFKEVHHLGQ